MTRSTLFDRLNHELEAFGKKAQAALDEGKLQIELLRLRRRLDRAARDLGLLVHRRERGGETEARRFDALLLRLDDLQAEVARLEKQIAESRGGGARGSQPAPAPQPPVEVGADRTDA
jgi:50S ribosomal subunit-associated GTPase HflX